MTARVLSLPSRPPPRCRSWSSSPSSRLPVPGRRVVAPRLLKQFLQARFPAVKSGFAHDSPLEQAGFEPSVPHLIGGVRRAIGKAADKLREAPDAGTRVAESSFFEPPNPPHRLRAIPAAKS